MMLLCFLALQTDLKNAGIKAWVRAVCFSSMGVKPVESNDAFLQELRTAAGEGKPKPDMHS